VLIRHSRLPEWRCVVGTTVLRQPGRAQMTTDARGETN
jgi:hypothetical protein